VARSDGTTVSRDADFPVVDISGTVGVGAFSVGDDWGVHLPQLLNDASRA
jgi:hypothetical protein